MFTRVAVTAEGPTCEAIRKSFLICQLSQANTYTRSLMSLQITAVVIASLRAKVHNGFENEIASQARENEPATLSFPYNFLHCRLTMLGISDGSYKKHFGGHPLNFQNLINRINLLF